MTLKAFAIYDSKAELYLQPFFMRSRGEALRAWTDSVNDEKAPFHRYPADYTLFEIGTYDESSGKMTAITNQSLGNAVEFKTETSHPMYRPVPEQLKLTPEIANQ